jgi:hypothetical protein
MEQLEIYFNTTNLKNEALKERQIKAGTQNALILSFFRDGKDYSYTPDEVHQYFTQRLYGDRKNWPITSVRRAITTLTDLGYLRQTGIMRKGSYGSLCNTWIFNM